MQQSLVNLSVVVPTLNEAGNIEQLVRRTGDSLARAHIPYEIICIDDHSSDRTALIVHYLAKYYPVRLAAKVGPKGKAYSLLQGLRMATGSYVCLIDADLQYSPEAIAEMYETARRKHVQLMLTKRHYQYGNPLRRLTTASFHVLFCRLLFGIPYDTQSGLKLADRRVFTAIDLHPSAWSFDLELVVRAKALGCKLASYDIPFEARTSGTSKARVMGVSYELAKSALKLKFASGRTRRPKASPSHQLTGAGL